MTNKIDRDTVGLLGNGFSNAVEKIYTGKIIEKKIIGVCDKYLTKREHEERLKSQISIPRNQAVKTKIYVNEDIIGTMGRLEPKNKENINLYKCTELRSVCSWFYYIYQPNKEKQLMVCKSCFEKKNVILKLSTTKETFYIYICHLHDNQHFHCQNCLIDMQTNFDCCVKLINFLNNCYPYCELKGI